MYDRAWRTGRLSCEIRTRLLVDPRVLAYDRSGRAFGARFEPSALDLDAVMPDAWRWVSAVTEPSGWLPDGHPIPGPMRRWFKTDHRERYGDALAFRTDPRLARLERLLFRLVVASVPLDDDYDEDTFQRDLGHVLDECLPELVDLGLVGVWQGDRPPLPVEVRFGVELSSPRAVRSDPGADGTRDPLRKVGAIGAGIWFLARFRDRVEVGDPVAAALDTALQGGVLARLGAVWDGWTGGAIPSARLARACSSRAHLLALTHTIEPGAVELLGTARLDAMEMAELQADELHASEFLATFAGEGADAGVARHREILRHCCALEDLEAFVRATVLDRRTAPVQAAAFPLGSPRHVVPPGSTWLRLGAVPLAGSREVRTERGRLRLADPAPALALGRELARVVEVAAAIGDDLVRAVSGEVVPELEHVVAATIPRARYLLRTHPGA